MDGTPIKTLLFLRPKALVVLLSMQCGVGWGGAGMGWGSGKDVFFTIKKCTSTKLKFSANK